MAVAISGINMIPKDIASLPENKIEYNRHRKHLTVFPTAATTVTIVHGETVGPSFVLPSGMPWAPVPPPQNEIRLSGQGTIIEG